MIADIKISKIKSPN